MQMMALNLVVEHRSGADLLKDIALIGKWVYEGDNLQLLDKEGNVLATEALANIRRITFSVSGTVTDVENVDSQSILVYPNPTQDALMVQGIEAQELRVYDLQGRLLVQEEGTQVNVNHLAEGTYLLQIGTQVVRFIKN
jgi:myo-inositol-hexaphosphate 3-phosphohydrolase